MADDSRYLERNRSEPIRPLRLWKFFRWKRWSYLAKVSFESQKLSKEDTSHGKVSFRKFSFRSLS